MKKNSFFTAKTITGLSVLLALVVVLQLIGTLTPWFKVGAVSLSFVLVPIVLGGILYGVWGGTLLGFTFGVITFIMGLTGADAFTAILINEHLFGTLLICIVKATSAGAVSALVFNAIKQKKVGLFVASATAPVVNTGLFIIGCLIFVKDTLQNKFCDGMSVMYFLFIVCAGVNFLIELAISLVLAPVLYTVVKAVSRGKIK